MLKPLQKLLFQNTGKTIQSFLFFIIFFLYLWVEVDLRLIYHTVGQLTDFPVFFRGWDFFKEFLSRPGGLVEYLSGFLAQFLFFRSIGTVVVTLLAWLLCLCTDKIIKATDAPAFSCVRFVPPMLILIIYSQYMHFFATTVAALTALLFVNVHIQITRKNKLVTLVLFAESLTLYYLAGGAYLLFVVLCVIYEFIFTRRWKIGLISLALGGIIPYLVGVIIFDISVIDAFGNLLPFSWKIVHYAVLPKMLVVVHILYLFLPLTMLSFGLWRLCFRGNNISSIKPHVSMTDSNQTKLNAKENLQEIPFSQHGNMEIVRWFIKALILFGITIVILLFYNDPRRKSEFEVDYYLSHNMWQEVLEVASHYPDEDLMVHAADLALYHTGRLGYDLFKYHRNHSSLFAMLLSSRQYEFMFWKRANLYFHLGLINKSERNFVESLSRFGKHPYIIQRLALVYIIKGKVNTARIYLKRLAKTMFYSDWANDYLARLESDPDLSSDQNVIQSRNLIMIEDRLSPDIQVQLLGMLEDRKNHMAFEYLMAVYLLEKRCDKIVENLHLLKDYNYPRIPKLYEEAVLVYEYKTKKKVPLHGYQISKATRQRFKNINEADTVYGNKELALKELSKTYGDSFILYYIRKTRR